jgi:hypothetical protein
MDGIGSQSKTSERRLGPEIRTLGALVQTVNTCQPQGERHLQGTSKITPLRSPAPIGRSEGTQDDQLLGHAEGLFETTDLARNTQMSKATGRDDALGEGALSGARQAEDPSMDRFGAANIIDKRLQDKIYEHIHQKDGRTTAAGVPTVADHSKKAEPTDFAGTGKDAMSVSPCYPHHQDPAHPPTTSVAPPSSLKGEQVDQTLEVTAINNQSGLDAQPAPRNPLSRSPPGPPQTARELMQGRCEAQQVEPASQVFVGDDHSGFGAQTVPHRTPPREPPSQPRPSGLPASGEYLGPRLGDLQRDDESAKRDTAEAAATPAVSPPQRKKRPIKIILHFGRKQRAKTNADVAPESKAAEESHTENTETPHGPSTRGGSSCDGADNGLGANADGDGDEDAYAEEEVVLL